MEINKHVQNYLKMVLLRNLGNINKNIRCVLEQYINFRIDLGKRIVVKENGNGFVIYDTGLDGEKLLVLEVTICNTDLEYIKVRCVDIEGKDVLDNFRIYEDGIIGHLGSTIPINGKDYMCRSLFKGDVVIPDSSDKTSLVWLEGSNVQEIFEFGLISYKALSSDMKYLGNSR